MTLLKSYQLTEQVKQAIDYFGVLTAEEVRDKLVLRGILARLEDIKRSLLVLVSRGELFHSSIIGCYRAPYIEERSL